MYIDNVFVLTFESMKMFSIFALSEVTNFKRLFWEVGTQSFLGSNHSLEVDNCPIFPYLFSSNTEKKCNMYLLEKVGFWYQVCK